MSFLLASLISIFQEVSVANIQHKEKQLEQNVNTFCDYWQLEIVTIIVILRKSDLVRVFYWNQGSESGLSGMSMPLLLHLQGKPAPYPYLQRGRASVFLPWKWGTVLEWSLHSLFFLSPPCRKRNNRKGQSLRHTATFTRGKGCWIVNAFWMLISEGTWCIWTQEAEIESIFGSSWQGVKWGWKGRWRQTFASPKGEFLFGL